MAKLSAHGSVVVTVTREYTEAQLQAHADKLYPEGDPLHGPSLCVWERKTKRLMSDGKILEKLDVRFRPSPHATWEPKEGRYHSYGWKLAGKLKAGVTPEQYAAIYRGPTKSGQPSPYTVTDGATPDSAGNTGIHPKITLARVTRAVKRSMSDLENPGFCLKCGAEADGCEPDARDYQCESCGQMSVYGAEEVLTIIA